MKIVKLEIEYDSARGYHLIGASIDIKLPRRRWYDSHGDVIEAVQALNPDHDIR